MTTARRIIDGTGLRAMRMRVGPAMPTPTTPAFVATRSAACGIGKAEPGQCDELEEGTYCELAVELTGKLCRRGKRMRAFLRDPDSECPLGTWGPEKKADDDGCKSM